MKYTLRILLNITFFLIFPTIYTDAIAGWAQWAADDKGMYDCKKLCEDVWMKPLMTHQAGPFAVCSIEKRGERPGFNYLGSPECSVGTGGRPARSTRKSCLCTDNNNSNGYEWKPSFGVSCDVSCDETKGLEPVSAGKVSSSPHYGIKYYICAGPAFDSKHEDRPGYNLSGDPNCVIASGGKSSASQKDKKCLCKAVPKQSAMWQRTYRVFANDRNGLIVTLPYKGEYRFIANGQWKGKRGGVPYNAVGSNGIPKRPKDLISSEYRPGALLVKTVPGKYKDLIHFGKRITEAKIDHSSVAIIAQVDRNKGRLHFVCNDYPDAYRDNDGMMEIYIILLKRM